MDDGVPILGGYQSDFASQPQQREYDFADLTRRSLDGIATAAIDAADLAAAGVVHVAERLRRDVRPSRPPRRDAGHRSRRSLGHAGHPHEAACASGSVATLAAMADLRSGVLRLSWALELEKTAPWRHRGRASECRGLDRHEGAEARYLWPSMSACR